MSERHDDNEEDVVMDGVNDAVIAHSNPEARSTS